MTGYLGRMAARAAGATTAAEVAPRLPSRYEHLDPGPEAKAGPGAGREATASGAAAPLPTARERRPAERKVAQQWSDQQQRDQRRGEEQEPTPRPTARAVPTPPAEQATEPATERPPAAQPHDRTRRPPTRSVPDQATDDDGGRPPARRRDAADRTAEPKPPSAVPAVPIAPAAAPWPGERRDRRPEAGPRQPDVVVVSVGRVEVRAAVTAAPAAPATPAREPRPSAAEGLSLQDYLRGRREVR